MTAPQQRVGPVSVAEPPPHASRLPASAEWGRIALAVAAIGAAVFVQFWPILQSDFQLEDFAHLYDFANYGLAKLLLAAHGGHSEVTSNLVFVVFQSLFGLEPSRWFAAALGLHVLNAGLLVALLRRTGCSIAGVLPWVLAWALCPVHIENLAWMATIGEVMTVTYALCLLRSMVDAAETAGPVLPARRLRWWLLGLAAATSYSMGIAVAGTLWIAAAILLSGVPGRARTVAFLATLAPFFPVLYWIQHRLHAHLYGLQEMYESPVYSVPLAAMVHAAVQALQAAADLAAYGLTVLPFAIMRAPDGTWANAGPLRHLPVATLIVGVRVFALATLALLPWALGKQPPVVRRLAVVLTLFVVATYGTIAWGNEVRLVNAPKLANVSGPPAFQTGDEALVPRYHYVGTAFVAALLALAVEGVAGRGVGVRRATRVALLLLAAGTAVRIPGARAATALGVANARILHPRAAVLQALHAAARSAPPGSIVHLPNAPLGRGFVGLKGPYFPGWSAFCLVFVSPDCSVDGRLIRFVEPDGSLLETIRAQAPTPISRLVVPP